MQPAYCVSQIMYGISRNLFHVVVCSFLRPTTPKPLLFWTSGTGPSEQCLGGEPVKCWDLGAEVHCFCKWVTSSSCMTCCLCMRIVTWCSSTESLTSSFPFNLSLFTVLHKLTSKARLQDFAGSELSCQRKVSLQPGGGWSVAAQVV